MIFEQRRKVEQMHMFEGRGGGGGGSASVAPTVFLCYAHADNDSSNPKERWLDRFVEMFAPLVRQNAFSAWSDTQIKIGDDWHARIQGQLKRAKAVVLFVSPAFLASDYIASSELPVLLKRAQASGVVIYQVLLSPSLWNEALFRFPDPVVGPEQVALKSLQTANPPSKTLVELSEAQQNRVLMKVASEISALLGKAGA